MRRFIVATFTLGLVASAAGAAPKAGTPASENALKQGLQAVVAPLVAENTYAQSNAKSGGSKSQGAEHASDTAIMKVCSHNNPSAQRSAICAHPISPD
jgi:hypothetical protein